MKHSSSSSTNPSPVRKIARLHKTPYAKPITTPQLKAGPVFVVGSGDCGQLGLGQDVLEAEKPMLIKYLNDKQIVKVFAGGLHNIALTQNGQLYSWGCNDQKALGRTGEETEPGLVPGIENVISVACGDSVSAALTADGRVYTWGTFRDANGIFGLAPGIREQLEPRLVSELKNIIQIEAGTNHLVATSRDGKIYTWGVGEQGQLGRKVMSRHIQESSLIPRPINFRPFKLSSRFSGAFAGGYHTFIVHETGSVYSFGLNNYGQLGLGHTESVDAPEQVEGFDGSIKIVEMGGGEHHSIALDSQGQVWTFGRGDSGQLGILPQESRFVPSRVSALASSIQHVSAGGAFSLAVSQESGNNIYLWGYGEMGQLGNESQDSPTPHKLFLKDRVVFDASAGGQTTVLLLNPKE